jgi:hypothetical protein
MMYLNTYPTAYFFFTYLEDFDCRQQQGFRQMFLHRSGWLWRSWARLYREDFDLTTTQSDRRPNQQKDQRRWLV